MTFCVPFLCESPRVRYAFFLFAFSVCGGIAHAQSKIEFDPLGLPGSVLLCRSMPVTPRDSAAFVFQYLDGSGSEATRNSFAAFDSVGKPLYMMLSAEGAGSRGELQRKMVVVRFFAQKSTGGILVIPDPLSPEGRPVVPGDSTARPKVPQQPLTDEDVVHAKALAEWYWTHRCRNSVEGQ